MGKSFTAYRDHGFWTADSKLELWLYALCQQIDGLPDPPAWLEAARLRWHQQATVGFEGCVDADLDRILGRDPTREARLRDIVAAAASDLNAHQPLIPRAVLNSYHLGGGADWREDLPTAVMAPLIEAFDALVAGEMDPGATAPVV